MKYYAKLMYKGKLVGYRYGHKGKFYDIDSDLRVQFGVIEENNKVLDLIPVGENIMTESERDSGVYAEDLSDDLEKFKSLLLEDAVQEVKVEEPSKPISTPLVKKYVLSNRPTKKKTVLSKGVGVLIAGEDETLVHKVGSSNVRYLCIVSVSSKTAVISLSKILGATFNVDARVKDFEKGKKEFKLKISPNSLKEMRDTFGLTPCLSQKQGYRYTLLDGEEKVFQGRIRLTDFAVPKDTDNVVIGGKDYERSFGDFREALFNNVESGNYILLGDI